MDKPTSTHHAMAAPLNPFNINAFDGNESEVRQALFELQQQFAIHLNDPDSEDRVFSHKMEEMMEDIIEDIVETEEHEHDAQQTGNPDSQELSRLSGAELERLIKHEKKLRKKKNRSRDKKVKTPRSPRSPKSPRKITPVRSQEWNSENSDNKNDKNKSKEDKPKEKRRRGSKIKIKALDDVPQEEGFAGSEESFSEAPLSPSQSAEMLSSSPSKFKYAAYKGRVQRSNSTKSSSSNSNASTSTSNSNSDHTASGELPEPVTVRYAARGSLDADIAKVRAKNKERGKKKVSPALSKLMVKGVMGYLPFRTSHLSGLGE